MIFKRKNKKGFTLVELVVVMCIFGMILSCILNFIKPANEVHNDVQATMDANVISSGLIEYIDDELRYANNVLVLQDYIAVPQVSDKGYVGDYNIPFTNCIMIDNTHFRGYSTKGYSGSDDDTDAKKVGATGCVIKINKLDEEGFNFNNSSVVKGEDFYDKFKFNIQVGTNVIDEDAADYEDLAKKNYYDPSLKSIQVSVETSYPVWKNGHYEFVKKFDRGSDEGNEEDKTKNRGAVISFTNINLDKHDKRDLEVVKVSKELNPTQSAGVWSSKGFPVASAPAGATAQQAEYYAKSTEHFTYIFYSRNSAGLADTGCTRKFVTDTPTANTQVASPITGFTKGEVFKSFPSAPTVSGYSSSYWCAPDGTVVDPAVGYTVTADSTFKLVYVKDPEPSPYTVTWIQPDGSTETVSGPTPVGAKAAHAPPIIPESLQSKKAVNEETGGWVEQGTGKPVSEVPVDKDRVFVADLVDKYPVHFKFSDSKTVDIEPVIKGKYATAPGETPDAPEGKQFEKWVLQGDESKDISVVAITKETTFVPKFIEKKAGLNSPSKGITPTHAWWDCVKYEVVIVNNTSEAVSDWKVELTFQTGMTFNQSQDWRIVKESESGNKVVLKPGNGATVSIPAGGSITIPVCANLAGIKDPSQAGPTENAMIAAAKLVNVVVKSS